MNKLPKNVYKNLDFLKKLSKTRSLKKREKLFKEATKEQLFLLVEISYNILNGYFPLSLKQKLRILPYAQFVRKLGKTRTEKKAREIVQRGGGLINFAPLLLPIITKAIKGIIDG